MANNASYSAAVATKEENRAGDESPSSSSRPGDGFVFSKAQALIPQEPPQEYVNEGLTWEDDYYNNKEDIVAVFDVDGKTVSDFHYSIALKYFPAVFLLFVLFLIFFGLKFTGFSKWYYGVLAFVFLVLCAMGIVIIFIPCTRARRAKCAKIHIAVTSDCIQYDQDSPDVHIMAS
jgi:hypothetical protein